MGDTRSKRYVTKPSFITIHREKSFPKGLPSTYIRYVLALSLVFSNCGVF